MGQTHCPGSGFRCLIIRISYVIGGLKKGKVAIAE